MYFFSRNDALSCLVSRVLYRQFAVTVSECRWSEVGHRVTVIIEDSERERERERERTKGIHANCDTVSLGDDSTKRSWKASASLSGNRLPVQYFTSGELFDLRFTRESIVFWAPEILSYRFSYRICRVISSCWPPIHNFPSAWTS